MPDFKNIKDLNKYLQKQINEVLNKEVAKQVKEEIQQGVSSKVYEAGKPEMYIRRGAMDNNEFMGNPMGTGSLADIKEMKHKVKDGTLTVTNEAKKNICFPKNKFGYDDSKSLAYNIEFGYGDMDFWFNRPRQFMKEAINNMKENKGHIDAMIDGLKKKGFEVENSEYI